MLPFPRFRLSLPVALLLIVLIAWNLWWLRAVLGLSRMVSTVTLEALDGDERALARDITSAPVLEHALSLMSMGKRCQESFRGSRTGRKRCQGGKGVRNRFGVRALARLSTW